MKKRLTSLVLLISLLHFNFSIDAQDFSGGNGTKNNPYQIKRPEQLDKVRNYLNSHFKLMNDLDMSGFSNFTPLSSGNTYFRGSFDGNNHTISNLTIDFPLDYIGLFGYYYPSTTNDSIKNLRIENVNINGSTQTGALVGRLRYGTIYNCSSTGKIEGRSYTGGLIGYMDYSFVKKSFSECDLTGQDNSGGLTGYSSYCTVDSCLATGKVNISSSYSGGLIGTATYSNISNCSATGDAIAIYDYVGGLIGYIENNTPVSNSHATGMVSGRQYIGGLIGRINNNSNNSIVSCFAKGNVSGSYMVGGLIGLLHYTPVEKCFATGNVNNKGDYSGGLIGYVNSYSPITNCYSTGSVSGASNYYGGIVGRTESNSTINYCFSTGNISGLGSYCGGIAGYLLSVGQNLLSINPTLNGNNVGRIFYYSNYSSYYNYAWEGVKINNSLITNGTINNNQGANVVLADLSTDAFYTNPSNWNSNPWDFSNVWKIDTSISIYPILKSIESSAQKITHSDATIWNQELSGNVGDTLLLNATGYLNDSVEYISDKPAVAEVIGKKLVVRSQGIANITAYSKGNKYSDNRGVTKTFQSNQSLGSKGNPILIKTTSQLDSIRYNLSAHYKLMANLNLFDYPNWQAIGTSSAPFTGSFDGNGHVISNMRTTQSNSYYGLFGYFVPTIAYDSIKNLGLVAVEISTSSYGGGIAGYARNASFSGCFVTGTINSYGQTYIGSILGYGDQRITIDNCYTTTTIKGGHQTGGIAGYVGTNSEIRYCYATGSIISNSSYVGGIMANSSTTTVRNCIANNAILVSTSTINRISPSASYRYNNYAWDGMSVNNNYLSGSLNDNNGFNVSSSQLSSFAFYTENSNWNNQAWDFSNFWILDTTNISPFPILRKFNANYQLTKHDQITVWNQSFNPVVGENVVLEASGRTGDIKVSYTTSNELVANITGTQTLEFLSNGNAYLVAKAEGSKFFKPDLDGILKQIYVVESITQGTKNDPILIYNASQLDDIRKNLLAHYRLMADIDLIGREWTPIGNNNNPFKGSFDGNGHKIKNMSILTYNNTYQGLFGFYYPTNSYDTIKNIRLENVKINSSNYSYVGAIAGYISNGGSIIGCYVSGTIAGNEYAGGFVGYLSGGRIENCQSQVNVNTLNSYCGGIAGYISSVTISGCFSSGKINGNGSYTGGITGYNNYSTIQNCYSTSSVYGNSSYTGGITGYNYNSSIIQNCYSTGRVSSPSSYLGGIAGRNRSSSQIKNCVAINANISGSAARITGSNAATLYNNYGWENMYVNGSLQAGSLTDGNGLSQSYSSLKDSLFYKNPSNWNGSTAWDFTNTWTMDTTQISPFPILKALGTQFQQIKHDQAISWNQALSGSVGETITLEATGGNDGQSISYSSKTPAASVNGNQLTFNSDASVMVYAKVSESKFFKADSIYQARQVFEGSGTRNNPYLIYTLADLNAVRNNLSAYYKLMADIDLKSITNWEPIGISSNRFRGAFDGNGHVIKNLTIDRANQSYIGLFAFYQPTNTGDSIKNLGLIDVNIKGSSYTGGIVGYMYYYGKITGCFVSGDIQSTNSQIGGIAGYIENYCEISNCYSVANITGCCGIGGIVGSFYNESKVSYCYSSGIITSITQNNSYYGGISGGYNWGIVQNCIALNPSIVTKGSTKGRIIGGYPNIYNNYAFEGTLLDYVTIKTGNLNGYDGLSIPLSTIQDESFYTTSGNWRNAAWDFTNTWKLNTSTISPYPILRAFSDESQQIKHPQITLWNQNLAGKSGDTIKLTATGHTGNQQVSYISSNPVAANVSNDTLFVMQSGTVFVSAFAQENNFYKSDLLGINKLLMTEGGTGTKSDPFLISRAGQLDSMRFNLSAHFKLIRDIDLIGYPNWIPIGSNSTPFTGSLDGNGYIVKNLKINSTNSYQGLLGYYSPTNLGDSIKNLGLVDVRILGSSYAGTLAGSVYNGSVVNCFASGIVETNSERIGGLIGNIYGGKIENCYTSVNCSGTNYVGGIVGYIETSTSISYCFSSGTANGKGSYTAGIVGVNNGTTKNCFTVSVRLNGNSGINRVVGTNGNYYNNYAWEQILTNNQRVYSGTLNNYNGLSIPLDSLKNINFFTRQSNWHSNMAWNFSEVWTFDAENTSPYPILRVFAPEKQKIKHSQIAIWTKPVSGKPVKTIGLFASGMSENTNIEYTSSNIDAASVNGSELIVKKQEDVYITAYSSENQFYYEDLIGNTTKLSFAEGSGTLADPFLISTAEELNQVRNNLSAHYKLVDHIDLSSFTNWIPIGSSSIPFSGSFDGNGFEIINLKISNSSSNYLGLFGAFNPSQNTYSIKNLGVVKVNILGGQYVGGIVGSINFGKIENCYVTGNIKGNSDRIGGVTGFADNSQITKTFTNCKITGYNYVGGIVGRTYNTTTENSYSSGKIFANQYGAGIHGYSDYSTINYCYSTAIVYSYYYSGGLQGSGHIIKNSVAANAKIDYYSGGSRVAYSSSTYYNNYSWQDMYLNTSKTSGSTNNSQGQNKTMTDLKSETFYTTSSNWYNNIPWDFENTWTMNSSVSPYPVLKTITSLPQKIKHPQVIVNSKWNQYLPENGTIDEWGIPLTCPNDAPGGELVYSTDNSEIADIQNNKLYYRSLGSTSIYAQYPASNFYESSDRIERKVDILNKATQNISWSQSLTFNYTDVPVKHNIVTNSAKPLEYTFDNPGVVEIIGDSMYIKKVGTTNITVQQSASDNYFASNVITQTLTVNPMPITIQVDASNTKIYGNPDPQLSYSITNGTLAKADQITGKMVRASGENVGTYAINQGTLALNSNYVITFIPGNFTITHRDLKIIANSIQKVPGTTYSFTNNEFTTLNLLTTDTVQSVSLTSAGAASGATLGEYPIIISSAIGNRLSNYDIHYQNGIMYVKNLLELSSVSVANKVYDGTTLATITGFGSLTGTITPGDVVSLKTNQANATFSSKDVKNNIPVNLTGIRLTGADSAKYYLKLPSVTANITSKPITVAALSVVNKEYDGNTTAAISNITFNGVVNNDNISVTPMTGTFALSLPGNGLGVTFNFALSGQNASNYSLTSQPIGITGIILPKKIHLSGGSVTPKIYNGNSLTSITGAKLVGVLTGEQVRISDSTASFETANAGDLLNATTQFKIGGTNASNYEIVQRNYIGGISKALVTATAQNKSIAYGSDVNGLLVVLSGFVGSDTEYSIDNKPIASITKNTNLKTGNYDIIVSGGNDNNYNFQYVKGSLTVTKANLTVIANSFTKVYGQPTPGLSLSYKGWINNDNEIDLDVKPTVEVSASAMNVGTYPITPSGGTDDNYNLHYELGTLTITKANLNVQPISVSKTYGQSTPQFKVSYSGWVNNETETVIDIKPTVSIVSGDGVNSGTYVLKASGGSDNNYNFVFSDNLFAVNKAILKVTSVNKSKTYGGADPSFTFLYSGFVGSETESVLDEKPIINFANGVPSQAGSYPIIVNKGFDNNYEFLYENGIYNINKAPLKVSTQNVSRNEGTQNPDFKITYSGFVNNESENVIQVKPIAVCNATLSSPAGLYDIELSGGIDQNYSFTYENAKLTVIKSNTVSLHNTLSDNNLKVYPNPFSEKIMVCLNENETAYFELFSVAGEIQAYGMLNLNCNQIETTHLSKGIYLLTLYKSGEVVNFRLVKK